MNTKIVSTKEEFTLPEAYKKLQTEVRRVIVDKLKRTNGTVTEKDFESAFTGFKNLQALKQRLFVLHSGDLEWKQDIVSLDDLARKLGSPDKITKEIKALFTSSKYLHNRNKYSNITPSNKKDKIRGVYEEDGPVYGFDILIRPIVEKFYSETGEAHNDLILGRNCFAIVIHTHLDDQGNLDPSDVMFRYVSAEGTRDVNLLSYLMGNSSKALRQEIIVSFSEGKVEKAVSLILNMANMASNQTIRSIGP